MAGIAKIARRSFLIGTAAIAGGVAVGAWYVARPYPNPLEDGLGEGETTFNPFVKIAADDTITVIAPRAEMGQGIATTLAAFVAEELNLPLDMVTVEHGPASWAYYNGTMMEDAGPFPWFDEGVVAGLARSSFATAGKVLGLQGTGGSCSARDGFDRMREAGAAARHVLVQAAARRLGVPAGELTAENGTIAHAASDRSLTYGEVAAEAAGIAPPSRPALKDRSEWRLLGKPQKRVDMLAKVTGAPIYGIDVRLPDMLYGTVRMSPVFGGAPARVDLAAAEAVPGVVRIVALDTSYGRGFGVIAENTWATFMAAELIEAEWSAPAYPAEQAAIDAALAQALDNGGASVLRDDGDVDTDFADAPRERMVEAEYAVPFLAHFCMEPMNATALAKDGGLELWAPNQMPTVTEQLCAAAVGVPTDRVVLHTTHLGGGFGRRADADFAIYAALMAKAVEGRPVKAVWTREEDVRHDFYRPAARARLAARTGDDGMPVALDFRLAAPSIIASTLARTYPSLPAVGPDILMAQGGFDQPYAIPSFRFGAVKAELGIPVGIWRSVGFSHNAFFLECFLDEIAERGGLDPVAMRRSLMKDFPAALAVVEKVAAMSGWGHAPPAGRARGLAFTLCFGSWVGEVVEVSEGDDGIRIEKVWIAADVGTALDPGIIEAQLVSGAIFGLSAAMSQEITLKAGRVEQSNLHDFDAMRIHQCPDFEVAILETQARMGGVGEIGTPPAVAALCNAVSRLKGRRLRALPLSKEITFA